MSSSNRFTRGGLAAALCLSVFSSPFCAATAEAAEPGFYLGGGVGQSKFDQDKSDLDFAVSDAIFDATRNLGLPVALRDTNLDDSDQLITVFAGYRIFRFFAAEVAYVDLGELTYTGALSRTSTFMPMSGSLNATVGAKGGTASALAIWPVSDVFELFARGGFFVADTEIATRVVLNGITVDDSIKGTSVDPMIGLGATVNLGDHFSLRAEYQRYGAVGDEDKTGEIDVDTFNVSAFVRF